MILADSPLVQREFKASTYDSTGLDVLPWQIYLLEQIHDVTRRGPIANGFQLDTVERAAVSLEEAFDQVNPQRDRDSFPDIVKAIGQTTLHMLREPQYVALVEALPYADL